MAFGAAYALRTPFWQAPDEPAHFNYIQHITRGDGLPVLLPGDYNQAYLERLTTERFPPSLPTEPLRYESHQPPLYYLLMTPAAAVSDGSVLVLRFVSLALGLILLALTWAIGRTLFPAEPWMAVAMFAFVALLPQHLATAASVNNDILAEVLVAAVLLASLRLPGAQAPLPAPRWLPATTGVLVGAALITKTTAYAAAVLPALAVITHVARARPEPVEGPSPASRREAAKTLAIAYTTALAIALPWWLRNATVYGGADILGLARHAEVVAGQPAIQTWTPGHIRDAAITLFQSFWLQLGWMAIPAEPWVYNALALISGVIAAGAVVALSPARLIASSLLLALFVLVLLQTVVYNAQFLQPQGRYLFPALVPIAAFAALGLRELTSPRWFPASVAAMVAGLTALNVHAHLILVPILAAG